ncbi:M20 metallopeptidase family protein [Clostridium algidicarnis]|uniref:M20 metallopeptidase family protein n=1 Tax=Clostridium algidicarnis TaxID=37659 RepID=UPI003FD81B45
MKLEINVTEIEENVIKCRRCLHMIPEIGLTLPKTAKYIRDQLTLLDIEFEELSGISAIIGTIKGNGYGPTVAVRADMDALPIEEETGLEFASKNGSMHACGHDGHMSILLSVAKVLVENKEKFNGTVKLIFQPGEEGYGGAKKMIDQGVIKRHDIDFIISQHIGSIFDDLKNGEIAVGYDVIMSCLDKFSLTIKGKGAHGAQPHKAIDPITISSQVIQGIQSIVSREIDTTENAVISIGKIQGGIAHNIIPSKVEMEGTVRTTNEDIRKYISKRMEEVAKGITFGMNASYEYEYTFGYPMVRNNNFMVDKFIKAVEDILPKEKVKILNKPTMIGEDISYFLNEIPGVYFFLGSKKQVEDVYYSHHSCKFDIDEGTLYKGVLAIVQFILNIMRDEYESYN